MKHDETVTTNDELFNYVNSTPIANITRELRTLRAENERLTYELTLCKHASLTMTKLHDEKCLQLDTLTAELAQERERNRWSIKDKKFTGYKGAFNGLRAHHNSMMKLAINYLTHVTGSGDNSVEHYWKSDCNTCKEIASFIASWRPIVPPEVE